jgi:hypothetical protein
MGARRPKGPQEGTCAPLTTRRKQEKASQALHNKSNSPAAHRSSATQRNPEVTQPEPGKRERGRDKEEGKGKKPNAEEERDRGEREREGEKGTERAKR